MVSIGIFCRNCHLHPSHLLLHDLHELLALGGGKKMALGF